MKRTTICLFLVLALLALCAGGCEKSESQNATATVTDDDTTGDDDTPPPSDDDDTPPPPDPIELTFDLDMELRGKAQLQISQTGRSLTASFLAMTGNDIIRNGTKITGNGKYRELEGGLRFYAILFDGPAVTYGPCQNKRIGYSITLMAKADNPYVSGGLTAYCDTEKLQGTPARVYRLSGR
jgi:hypothetical protein